MIPSPAQWVQVTAAARIEFLAQELPYAMSVARKKKKKKKKTYCEPNKLLIHIQNRNLSMVVLGIRNQLEDFYSV